ncbi:MAG: nucleotide exchange factor GrpE [Candidatus Altiarchaeales archaeon]|nr:nucleotide exchange factor GrpE [Candidatus Altiarchaeales archaeon]
MYTFKPIVSRRFLWGGFLTKKKEEKSVEEELTQLKEQLSSEQKEKTQYLELVKKIQADFENYRKRMEQQAQEQKKYANQKIICEMLPVKDNLEQALENTGNPPSLCEGVKLTLKTLENILAKHGVEEIEAENKCFDPNLHEAFFSEQGDVEKEQVAQVLQKGYKIGSRVVRPVKVKVLKPMD